MLALGPCVMAMHVARPPLMQAYLPSSAVRSSAVRVQPPSCVEACMESPSEEYYQGLRHLASGGGCHSNNMTPPPEC